MPCHTFVNIIILAIIPFLLFDFRCPSFLEAVQKHIIINFVEFLLENVLALVDVAAETNLHQTIQSLDLNFGVLIA